MKVTTRQEEFKQEETLIVCFDVGKDKLNYFFCYRDAEDGQMRECESHFGNRSSTIKRHLQKFSKLGQEHGLPRMQVVCEPTGGYERSLLKMARGLGFRTAYVNPESVNKLQVVESNDSGKTDEKDPRTIHILASINKTLKQRMLPEAYLQLRRLHNFYEDEVNTVVQIRGHLHSVLHTLFCDYAQSSDFAYTKTGKAVLDIYGFNPYRITAVSWKQFANRLRKKSRVRLEVLESIYQAAQSSVLHQASAWEQEVLTQRLRDLYADWERHTQRKAQLREQMEEIYSRLPEHGTLTGIPRINCFALARVISQTGPLDDFRSSSQVIRIAGLNLRERRSGKYVGKIKISKKGRSQLRKALYQIAFGCLVKKGCIYHQYHEANKKSDGDSRPMKSYISIMRKFLKLIHGVHRSKTGFKEDRVFMSSSEFLKQDPKAA